MGSGISIFSPLSSTPPSQSSSQSVNNDHHHNLFNRYAMNYIIGHGATSCVIQAIDIHLNNFPVALKRIPLHLHQPPPHDSSSAPSAAGGTGAAAAAGGGGGAGGSSYSLNHLLQISLDELQAFKRINYHPFVVTLHTAFRHKSSCYLAMDYLGGGDLRRYLRLNSVLNEKAIAYIIGSIGSALHFLHSQGVIHRDLKPENIAFDLMGRPYLADFGISAVSTESDPIPISSSSSGTLAYLAPEVLTPTNRHSYQSDFWSLGVIAYELLFQHRPFKKHCPVLLIQFSANEYSSMWEGLLSQATSSPYIDFENIYLNSPKPPLHDRHFPSFPFHLKDDGSVPCQLQIPFPREVSPEITSMLKGLLDVRIPNRLGNLLQSPQFSEHALFQKYQFFIPQLHRIPSPLHSFIDPLTPSPNSSAHLETFQDVDVNFPSEIVEKLSQFNFTRSQVEVKQLFRNQQHLFSSEAIETSPGSNYYSNTRPPGHSNSAAPSLPQERSTSNAN